MTPPVHALAARLPGTELFTRYGQYREYHPDLRPYAIVLPRETVAGPRTLSVVRHLTARVPGHPAATVIDLGDGLSVRVFGPPATVPRTGAAVMWIHGGGYIFGTAAQDDRWCHRIAARTGAQVVSVEYRLAPEHPYPAALDDCHRALDWIAEQPGTDPARIVVAGASAGGGLAAALALRSRDHGPVRPALQLLLYPMLDNRPLPDTDSWHRMWGPRGNSYAWTSYLADATPAEAVPARRTDLHDLPPAWIAVGTRDLFHDHNRSYHQALSAAGTISAFTSIDGAFHGFDAIAPHTGIAQRLHDNAIQAIRDAIDQPRP